MIIMEEMPEVEKWINSGSWQERGARSALSEPSEVAVAIICCSVRAALSICLILTDGMDRQYIC